MFSRIIIIQLCVQILGKCIIKENALGYKEALCQNQGLTSVPEDLPTDIKRLDLNRNNLTKLNERQFWRYVQLEEICMDNNQLTFLESNAFCCLPRLQILSMSSNGLHVSKAYPMGIFNSLTNLRKLDISRNMRNKTKNRIFYAIPVHELVSLSELSIDLVYEPVFSDSFKKLHLLEIRFAICNIGYLRNNTFNYLPRTTTQLYMRDCNNFFTIESGALRQFPTLSMVDFTNSNTNFTQALNVLSSLQNRTMDGILFRNINHIAEIVLTREMMTYISTICLKTIDLSHNSIISIQDKSLVLFKYPQCFENFLLSANRFSVNIFAADLFIFAQRMTNLRVCDYSYVPLIYKQIVFLNVVKNGSKETIHEEEYVEGNTKIIPTFNFPSQIEFLRFSHIMARSGLIHVKLVNSSLKHLDISYFEAKLVPRFNFEGYNSLEHLDLSGISSTLTLGKYPILVHLKSLKMKQTDLYKVLLSNVSIFEWVPNLKKLDISNNFIWDFQKNSFGDMKYLTHLNLSHNIIEIVPDALTQFESLIELDLSFNLITTLPESIRTWIDHQHKTLKTFRLFLDKNALICSCDTEDFLSWVYKTKATLDGNKNYTCWLPVGKGSATNTIRVIENFHNYFVECKSKVWIKIGSSLLATIIVVLLCATTLYNFRWRIIFFFYHRFRIYAEKEIKLNFKFDVYISYSDDSASFVKKLLQPKLEREWGLKLCCEDRDFPIGASSADTRAASIRNSRHIVFIVTPSFIHNEWKHFEIERAKYEKLAKDLQKIVVITKNVSLNDIPMEFATIWKDLFLIEWPNDDDGVEMTWRKLRLWFF